MPTDDARPTPDRPDGDAFETDPEVSDGEAPQAMGLFTEQTRPDVRLDPDHPAFDRVQDGKAIDDEYPAEYNQRYVKEHGDHRGHKPAGGADAEAPGADHAG